jgi:hypothetical protein
VIKKSVKQLGRIVFGSALMVAMVGGSGCASFQGNRLNSVVSFPQVGVKKSVNVEFDLVCIMNGATLGISDAAKEKFANNCISRMKASNLFGEISKTVSNPDLKLEIMMEDEGAGSMGMAMLTGLTLYVIPSKVTETYRVSATLRDSKSNKKAEIKLEDSFTQWQQILLLPLLPFKSTIAEAAKCQNKVFDNLAVEVHKTGMLN